MTRRRTAALPALLLLLALAAAGCSSEPAASRDEAGSVRTEGAVDAFEVALGDCMDEPADAPEGTYDVESVRAVPCDQPHDSEVYSVFELPEGEFPGEEELMETGDARCLEDFETFIGVPYDDSKYDVSSLFPTRESWTSEDDREYVCIVIAPEGERLTGSLKGAEA